MGIVNLIKLNEKAKYDRNCRYTIGSKPIGPKKIH